MEITRSSYYPKPFFSNTNQPLRPALSRFGSSKEKPEKPSKNLVSWYQGPLSRAVAYFYTHPRRLFSIIQTLLPKKSKRMNPLMDPKHLFLFNPLHKIQFKSPDRLKIKGYWLPSKTPSDRTVIMGHGYFADFRAMLGVADPLRKAGYNILLFDFRAHGESEGDKTSIGYHETKDIAGAVSFVAKNYPKQSKHLFYMGHSMGAASIMMAPKSLEKYPKALALMNQRLEGLVLDSPYADLEKMVSRFVTSLDKLKPDNKALKIIGQFFNKHPNIAHQVLDGFNTNWKKYLNMDLALSEMKPPQLCQGSPLFQKPILLLHGTSDTVTPFEHGTTVYETLKKTNPSIQMVVLQGENHMSREWSPGKNTGKYTSALRGEPVYMNSIMDFLETTVNSNTQPKASGEAC